MAKPKPVIGLALGGGAARGLAHIGVLEVLEEEHIPVDVISGTSAGAVVGALYAIGRPAYDLYDVALEHGKKPLSLIDPALPRSGLIGGKRIKKLLNDLIGKRTRFKDTKIPFGCVATDILTGEEVDFKEGPVVDPICGSIAIPAVLNAVKYQDRYLVDGGLVNPVPVSLARDLGANFVIAVNVSPEVASFAKHFNKKGQAPNIIQIIVQSIYIGTNCLTRNSIENADVVINPEVSRFGAGEFTKVEEIIFEGRRAAVEAMPGIREALARCAGKAHRKTSSS